MARAFDCDCVTARVKKALFLANTDWYLWHFRLPLLRALRDAGWSVVVVSPPGPWGQRFAAEGLRWIPLPFSRHGLNPAAELVTMLRLIKLYREEKPDLVHHFTVKCVVYGGIAAKLNGVRAVINAVTGLGTLFTTPGTRATFWLPLVRSLYRLAVKRSHVIFQNPDDRAEFQAKRLLHSATAHLVRGSGVDVEQFRPASNPVPEPPLLVLLVARLLHEKGIREFVEAARKLRSEGFDTRFAVAGGSDPDHPAAVDPESLSRWRSEAVVEFLGHREDVREILQKSHIACLPSWREGTPRSLLEAMACGLPIVATDVPGCREVVANGDNGFLVAPRDPDALADALRQLITDPALRKRMGAQSRERARREFSQERVIEQTFDVYQAAMQ